MSPDRQIVRLMAAMILAIIAYVAPSAVQAHEGHAHHGRHQAAAAYVQAAPSIAETTVSAAPSRVVKTSARPRTAVDLQAPAVEPVASLRANDAGGRCCPAGCRGSCCGTMVCCASGIMSGTGALSLPVVRTAKLIPHDVAGRPGVGPEALPTPPRTLA
jgi:hypothetical protein